jgi:hypothetical protein
MSFILNPSFELVEPEGEGFKPLMWRPCYFPERVTLLATSLEGIPKTGRYCATFGVSEATASICYDFPTEWPGTTSFTALSWVRASGAAEVRGTLAFWDLQAQANVSCNFTAREEWQLVTVMYAPPPATTVPGQRQYRVEFYHHTPAQLLLIDSVNVM